LNPGQKRLKEEFKARIAAALGRPAEEGRQTLRSLLGSFMLPDAGAALSARDAAAAQTRAAARGFSAVDAAGAVALVDGPRPPLRAAEPGRDAATYAGSRVGAAGSAEPDLGSATVRAILGSVKDAIVTTDLEGRVTSANFSAQRVFSCLEDEMRGRDVSQFIPSLSPAAAVLAAMSKRLGDTQLDLTPKNIEACRAGGGAFQAELTVSMTLRGNTACYILSLRDVTDRMRQEAALRDSEARYRALVENASEAIVVLDVGEGRFVDANENAAALFKMSREALLAIGPDAISAEQQIDGLPSFGPVRGYIDSALEGGRPVFEWLHRAADGREIPCEVRFIRLPASGKRLIRASIIDISERRRMGILMRGERRILELIASNGALDATLAAIVELVDAMVPESYAAFMLKAAGGDRLALAAAVGLPAALKRRLESVPVGINTSPSGAAAALGRQVVVREAERDSRWGRLRDAADESNVGACCATPIGGNPDGVLGTLDLYFKAASGPRAAELDLVKRMTQLAGIAIRHARDSEALRASEQRFRELFDNVVDGVFQIDPDGELLSANPALTDMLGYEDFDSLKAAGKASSHHADRALLGRLMAEIKTHGRVRNFEYPMRRRDGTLILVLENSRVVRSRHGDVLYYEGTLTDITQRKLAQRALFKEKERAEVTLQSIGDAVVTTDANGNVDYLNPAAEQLSGWERRHAQGQPIDTVIRLVEDQTGTPIENPVLRALREARVVELADNVALKCRDGSQVAIQDSAAPIQDRRGEILGAVMVFHDVRRERQLHRKLSYQASHDSLTGLINRREFEERLSRALGDLERVGAPPQVLLYMDLDQFKVVNDTCGHTAGDLLLRQLGELLQSRVRDSDVLARLGGDEFAVLLSNCDLAKAVTVGEALREAIASFRFVWRDRSLQVGVSIGAVELGTETSEVSDLLSRADVACYVAKDLGRNRIHVYQEGDAAELHREMQWIARINKALEEQRFELFFQPIVAISDAVDPTPRFELLLRMREESGEFVPPNAFIPAAERYNIMPSLDRWVIEQVLENHVCGEASAASRYILTVNLSGTTLNDARFLDFILDTVGSKELPPGVLCFEITETAAIENLFHVTRFMNALRSHGCTFALDDFGSGLSSLTYLKNLPVDYLKIDGHFIRNVARDSADRSVVEAIARMATALDIVTIAERVESHAVMHALSLLGVGYAQGYHIARPRPIAELMPTVRGAIASES
jgi:diguanylate cyclase (GGDEF)-like protein/PAS domain S-box-containing protein